MLVSKPIKAWAKADVTEVKKRHKAVWMAFAKVVISVCDSSHAEFVPVDADYEVIVVTFTR